MTHKGSVIQRKFQCDFQPTNLCQVVLEQKCHATDVLKIGPSHLGEIRQDRRVLLANTLASVLSVEIQERKTKTGCFLQL